MRSSVATITLGQSAAEHLSNDPFLSLDESAAAKIGLADVYDRTGRVFKMTPKAGGVECTVEFYEHGFWSFLPEPMTKTEASQ